MEEADHTERKRPNTAERKPPGRASLSQDEKLLVGGVEAAGMLSISYRALDYLVANKQLLVRRIGTRVLMPSLSCEGSRAPTIQSASLDSGLNCRIMGVQKNIFATLDPNSHQNSHPAKTKKATSRVASVNYSFVWCLWLLR